MQAIYSTRFTFPHQTNFYRGKVRDVYEIDRRLLVMIASDRISAFDVILPRPIPYKGMILNLIAGKFLQLTQHIAPNWLLAIPHPNVSIGKKCTPFKVEIVVRGYLAGHALREYRAGKRTLCGVTLPENMKPYEPFPSPIITPTTKASQEHDMDISKDEIIAQGLVSASDYAILENYAYALYDYGCQYAAKQGLILADTKYEFGKDENGNICLIDEIHTPDSSRYFYTEDYQERIKTGQTPRQLSKEFVREWLMENNFQGKAGQQIPTMTDEVVNAISQRYIELYEQVTGEKFSPPSLPSQEDEIEKSVLSYLQNKGIIKN